MILLVEIHYKAHLQLNKFFSAVDSPLSEQHWQRSTEKVFRYRIAGNIDVEFNLTV